MALEHLTVVPAPAGPGPRAAALEARDFAHLGPDALTALNRIAVPRHFAANDFLYLQDDDAKHLYILSSGHVRLSYIMEDGSAVLHAILPPGQIFGELGVFENSTYCDMATAVGPIVSTCLPASPFRALCRQHPEIWDALSRIVARRYRSYITVTRDLSLKTLPARLAQAVLRVADGLGTRAAHAGREVAAIGPMVTQADLGLMARGSRGNVNRALKTWERAGWVALQDRSILILNRTKLETLSLMEGL